MADAPLNYHHLRYFWAVAQEGNLTRAARGLRVSQSALSSQIRQLEEQLGEALFVREGRTLRLTEAGQIAREYADTIFTAGAELVATVRGGRRREHVLRVGAVSTLSRNFQESFIEPLLGQPDVRLRLLSGSFDELLALLSAHALDVVLSNRAVPRDDAASALRCRRVARQGVSLVGRSRSKPFRFPADVAGVPLLLPGVGSEVRTAFDALCAQLDVRVRALAEVDDMALLRLLARDARAVALLPSIVVRDELRSGALQAYCVVPGVYETFYAVTIERQHQHPLLKPLLARGEDEMLAMGPKNRGGRRGRAPAGGTGRRARPPLP
ncbi:MAG: LysR family transcriptional regulator [Polyangiaceae bacterium]|nr:LysR family transcriptional regulator [Polyangiaceae bacterium]